MFEDLARSAIAVFSFALMGFCITWLISPLTTTWELARLKLSPRSMEDRLSGQSLVGPVIILGAIGFIISGIVGWSVGMLMQDFDPVQFAESSTHINVTLISLAIFAVTAYLTNSYARYGSGKPTNLGERLFELQHQERGFYSPDHMDKPHWLALRGQTTAHWEHLNAIDKALIERLVGCPVPPKPWENVQEEMDLVWTNIQAVGNKVRDDRTLAKKLWKFHPSHWIRLSVLSALAIGMLMLALDSGDLPVIFTALGLIVLALGVVPPLILRATRSADHGRIVVLARDLLWTQRTVKLIDRELEALLKPKLSVDSKPALSFRPLTGIKALFFKETKDCRCSE